MTLDTSGPVPKLQDAIALAKLCRMLRSMLRRYPQAKQLITQADFGASLDATTYIRISYAGRWTAEDMRDWLALFAVWCVARPEDLFVPDLPLAGVLRGAQAESAQLNGQRD
jgi:hypothetical protein